jgi:Na+-transporting NADH:ubiquinone oxidoreductase subunit NqrC
MTKKKKIVIIVVAAVCIIGIATLIYFLTQPKKETAVENLNKAYSVAELAKIKQRDMQRQMIAEDINTGITNYKSKFGKYPAVIDFQDKAVYLKAENSQSCNPASCRGVAISDVAVASGKGQVSELGATSTTSTQYLYDTNCPAGGYYFAFCMEEKGKSAYEFSQCTSAGHVKPTCK